jgi:hypothetical protein
MDLGGWLRSIGLEKYEAVLRDNEIDEAVLHKITEDHLRELVSRSGPGSSSSTQLLLSSRLLLPPQLQPAHRRL